VEFDIKPMSPVVLRSKVRTYIDLYRALHDLEEKIERRTEELRRTRDELRVLLDSIPLLVSFVGKDGRYVRVNRAYENWFGLPQEQIEGKAVAQMLGEEAYAKIRDKIERALSGQTVTYETEIPYRLGGHRNVRVNYVPFRNGSHEVEGFIVCVADITEATRAEDILRRSEAIVESSDDAIVSKSLDGIITTWNRAAERLFGYAAEEIVGKSILTVIPEDRRSEEQAILDRIRRGQRVEHFETVRRRKDGGLIDVSLTISPVKDASGCVIGASKIARDITEQKRTREQIRLLNAELERRVEERTADLQRTIQELDSFTYTVSHDLRAPLRTMHRYSDLIAEEYAGKPLDAQGLEHLGRISHGSRQMDQLIQDLLAYSHLARSPVAQGTVSLEETVREVVELLSGDIHERRAVIEVEPPLPRIRGDKVLVVQVLQNLLSNAIRFVEPGTRPHVWIRANPRVSDVVVWVEDNGIGIAPEYHERVFEIFQRLNPRRFPGTGIGLAIVKRAMDRMGGAVGVDSEPGHGSRFWMRFHRAEDP
jgi:PAS domain S-box-containing protein